MDVTKSIVAIRTQKGIKQAEMAEKLSVEQSYYSRLEKRGKKLSIEQVEEIAEALGVSFMELITYGQETPASSKWVKELEAENIMLSAKVQGLEEWLEIYKDRDAMRKEAFKLSYQNYKAVKEKLNGLDTLDPNVAVMNQIIELMATLAGVKES